MCTHRHTQSFSVCLPVCLSLCPSLSLSLSLCVHRPHTTHRILLDGIITIGQHIAMGRISQLYGLLLQRRRQMTLPSSMQSWTMKSTCIIKHIHPACPSIVVHAIWTTTVNRKTTEDRYLSDVSLCSGDSLQSSLYSTSKRTNGPCSSLLVSLVRSALPNPNLMPYSSL